MQKWLFPRQTSMTSLMRSGRSGVVVWWDPNHKRKPRPGRSCLPRRLHNGWPKSISITFILYFNWVMSRQTNEPCRNSIFCLPVRACDSTSQWVKLDLQLCVQFYGQKKAYYITCSAFHVPYLFALFRTKYILDLDSLQKCFSDELESLCWTICSFPGFLKLESGWIRNCLLNFYN